MRLGRGLAFAFALPLLASCAGAKPGAERRLILSMQPPELRPGVMIQVAARPLPQAEMAWVSGTVKVMGAPVMPFRPDGAGGWAFKTMVPAFASIAPGRYEARAWGDSKDGLRYEGNLFIDVK